MSESHAEGSREHEPDEERPMEAASRQKQGLSARLPGPSRRHDLRLARMPDPQVERSADNEAERCTYAQPSHLRTAARSATAGLTGASSAQASTTLSMTNRGRRGVSSRLRHRYSA